MEFIYSMSQNLNIWDAFWMEQQEGDEWEKGVDAIRSLVNARNLQLEYARVLQGTLLILVLMYGSEIMLWKELEKCRIKAVYTDNLRKMLGIRRMDGVLNACIRLLCGVTKG